MRAWRPHSTDSPTPASSWDSRRRHSRPERPPRSGRGGAALSVGSCSSPTLPGRLRGSVSPGARRGLGGHCSGRASEPPTGGHRRRESIIWREANGPRVARCASHPPKGAERPARRRGPWWSLGGRLSRPGRSPDDAPPCRDCRQDGAVASVQRLGDGRQRPRLAREVDTVAVLGLAAAVGDGATGIANLGHPYRDRAAVNHSREVAAGQAGRRYGSSSAGRTAPGRPCPTHPPPGAERWVRCGAGGLAAGGAPTPHFRAGAGCRVDCPRAREPPL